MTRGMPPRSRLAGSRNALADRGDSPGRRLTNEEQSRSAVTAAMAADNACDLWTTVEYRPSAQTVMDGPGRCARAYGDVPVLTDQKVACPLRAR
jgi:hypothetical protein